MMHGRGSLNQDADNTLMGIFAVLGGLVLLLLIAWFQFHTQLSWLVIKITWASINLLDLCYRGLSWVGVSDNVIYFIIPQEVMEDLPSLKYWLIKMNPKTVSFETFVRMLELGGYGLLLFTPFVAFACAYYIWKRSKAGRLSRVMNIFTLAKYVMSEFPQIRPAIIEDLMSKNPDKGHYRREDSPIRFAIKHHLLKVYQVDFAGTLLSETSVPTFDKPLSKKDGYFLVEDHYHRSISKLHNRCILDTNRTKEIFINQLGTHWTGSDNLPPMIRAIYAALITFVCADKDRAMELFAQFNRSWLPPKKKNQASIDVTGVDQLIIKYEKNERVQEIISQHAFTNTLMSRLLQVARDKGRLGTSVFIWLKVIDRTLWYSLNQEGGQCGWSEAASVRAHKLVELSVKGPVYKPCVDMAVEEFENYLLNSEGWIPLPKDQPAEIGV